MASTSPSLAQKLATHVEQYVIRRESLDTNDYTFDDAELHLDITAQRTYDTYGYYNGAMRQKEMSDE